MYSKIVVPLDGSKLAEAVLPHVRALAAHDNAEVVLLRVPIHPARDYMTTDPLLMASLHEVVESEAQTYLEELAAQLRAEGLRVTTRVDNGVVAETILEYAERVNADLIAMSTHGRSGVTRWLLGSVADKVVRAAKTPVLLVRPS